MALKEGGKELDHVLINEKLKPMLRAAYTGGKELWGSGLLSDHLQ